MTEEDSTPREVREQAQKHKCTCCFIKGNLIFKNDCIVSVPPGKSLHILGSAAAQTDTHSPQQVQNAVFQVFKHALLGNHVK